MSDVPDKDVAQLAGYLRAAARQRRLLRPWLADKHFQQRGGRLLYAVDTDIVKLFAAPEEMSVLKEGGREGYAQVFPDDENSISQVIGRALGRFIFYRLKGDSPLLVLPPLEEELKHVFEAVAQDAAHEQERSRGDFERVRDLVSKLKREGDVGHVIERLKESAPDLALLLSGRSGPSAELRRFSHLLGDQRIASPEFLIEQQGGLDSGFREALLPPVSLMDRLRTAELRNKWFDRLHTAKSKRASILIQRDAEAMARLEWINGRLDGNHRLAFVTGDASLYRAADIKMPDEAESFAERYLRHPRCYLAESYVLSPDGHDIDASHEESIETEFVDWLDTFLGKVYLGGGSSTRQLDDFIAQPDESLEQSARALLEKYPRIGSDLRIRWSEYKKHVVLSHGLSAASGGFDDPSIKKLAANMTGLFDKIKSRLEERVDETWNSCFEVAAKAGYGLLYSARASDHRPRNVPPLSFDSFKKTQAFVFEILRFHEKGQWDSDKYKRAITALRKEDGSGYSYYLAHALLFAAEGSWRVAAILAERAMEIARESDDDEFVSGREAAYLRAVALRHSAKRVKELARVEPMLALAEVYLKEDRVLRPNLKVCEIRFNAERVALDLTYYLFGCFGSQQEDSSARSLPVILSQTMELLDCLDGADENESLLMNVERNLLTNLFSAAILYKYMHHGEINERVLKSYLERYSRNVSEASEIIQLSYLVDVIYRTALLWLTGEGNKELLQRLSTTNIEKNSVMPYDRGRFEFIRNLVMQGMK